MSAIDFLHTVPQDRYEAASHGAAVGAGERRLSRGLREALRALIVCTVGVGLLAGLVALRLSILMPASFRFHG
jgi:hypothetical protein